MRKAIAALACVFLLTGRASASGTMLSDDEGNSARDRDRVIRDALAEAARLTNANGYHISSC